MKVIKAIVKEVFVILIIIIIFLFLGFIDNLTIHLPGKAYSRIPRYEISNDKKTVSFDNGYLIEFKRPPTAEEIINAYTQQDTSLIEMEAMDDDMFKSFGFANLNLSRGIIELKLRSLSLFILIFSYPGYLLSLLILWGIRKLKKLLNRYLNLEIH